MREPMEIINDLHEIIDELEEMPKHLRVMSSCVHLTERLTKTLDELRDYAKEHGKISEDTEEWERYKMLILRLAGMDLV